jgi:DNA repair exonuclease SbcCD ATPase subunit
MTRATGILMVLSLTAWLGGLHPARAQTPPAGQSAPTTQTAQRASDEQVKSLIERIERGADSFSTSLKEALNETRFTSTRPEGNINEFIKEFDAATDRLKERFSDRNTAAAAVEEVLKRAAAINNFMARQPLTIRAQNEWDYLRMDLNDLARLYNVTWVWPGVAATRPYRVNDQQMESLLKRLEERSDNFRAALKSSLEQTRFDDTKAEDNINQFVRDFERATDRLEERYDDDYTSAGATTEVLRRAVVIDRFLQRHKLTPSAQSAWTTLRGDLNELAKAYNFVMNWNAPTILIEVQVPTGQVAERSRKP